MSWFNPPLLVLWLQSNDALRQLLADGKGLAPDLSEYTGITGGIAAIFLNLIHILSGFLFDNYGLGIIAAVFVIRLMMLPLTLQQIRSMRTMQVLQPVQKEIMRVYTTKEEQNAKIMQLYSEYKINPLAGCLPMFIQIPILFSVYRALYDPSFVGHSFLGTQLLFPVDLTAARSFGHGPQLVDIIDVTVHQLGLQSQLWQAPLGLPLIGGHVFYWPGVILVLLYAGSSLVLQRVMKKVNAPDPEFEKEFKPDPKAPGAKPEQPDFGQQMQKQMGLMNVMILIFGFLFSAGALIYFIVQNVLMMLEYRLLAGLSGGSGKGLLGGGPQLNAQELKAFIRRPPPPLPQQALRKPVEPAAPSAAGAGGGRSGAVDPDSVNPAGSEPRSSGLGRPKRKRNR